LRYSIRYFHFRQLAGAVGPRNANEIGYGAEAGFYLVVLNPRWVAVKAQYTSVVLYPVRNYVGASQHPFEGRVREPRFVLLIAAADVGVVSSEPHLFKGEIVELVARRRPSGIPHLAAAPYVALANMQLGKLPTSVGNWSGKHGGSTG
jgi:hypothetical protein